MFFSQANRERADLHGLVKLVRTLTERGFRHPIVIRPHPAENLASWKRAFANHDHVHIRRQGDLAAWISAAKLLLHTSCTTGMEAFVLGTPAMSLMSAGIDWKNIITSNLVNPTFDKIEDAVHVIEAVFRGDGSSTFNQPSHKAELRRHLRIEPNQSAAYRIIEGCAELLIEESENVERSLGFQAFARASTSDRSIDLGTLTIDAVGTALQELSAALGFEVLPRIEEVTPGVILCHPLAPSPATAGHGSP